MSFSKMGIDLINVIEGASTKPFSFMAHYPGAGVGGHCIPVDPYYLIAYGEKNGFHHDFLLIARRINNEMPKFVVELAVSALNEKQKPMKGSNVAVLGLAYKPDIDDYRESPAFEIIKELKNRGANVRTFDPYVKEHSTSESVSEALENADAAVIVTGHSEFKKLTYGDFKRLGVKAIIDGRNIYPKELFIQNGIVYKGIGR
jgi:nucleotide sugar dehydrogenase